MNKSWIPRFSAWIRYSISPGLWRWKDMEKLNNLCRFLYWKQSFTTQYIYIYIYCMYSYVHFNTSKYIVTAHGYTTHAKKSLCGSKWLTPKWITEVLKNNEKCGSFVTLVFHYSYMNTQMSTLKQSQTLPLLMTEHLANQLSSAV